MEYKQKATIEERSTPKRSIRRPPPSRTVERHDCEPDEEAPHLRHTDASSANGWCSVNRAVNDAVITKVAAVHSQQRPRRRSDGAHRALSWRDAEAALFQTGAEESGKQAGTSRSRRRRFFQPVPYPRGSRRESARPRSSRGLRRRTVRAPAPCDRLGAMSAVIVPAALKPITIPTPQHICAR